jgi:predicted DNA-binding mobile mystery protein A
MRNKKQLQIEQLDMQLRPYKEAKSVIPPARGWVNSIRTSLNMTLEQLGSKLKITKGAIQKIEEREATGQISINKLKAVGHVLDMKLVYGFVPNAGSIENLVHKKSEILARKIVMRTNQNMKLEDQGIGDGKLEKSIQDLASEIKRELKKSLWD